MSRKCDLLNIGVLSGNNVSHSKRRTKRKFYPNLHFVSYDSVILGYKIRLKLASKTIRTINKYGDFDDFMYVFKKRKLSEKGQVLKNKFMKKYESKKHLLKVKLAILENMN